MPISLRPVFLSEKKKLLVSKCHRILLENEQDEKRLNEEKRIKREREREKRKGY